jgi:glycosyltransferase involved in cell wall biosynthesis
VAAEPRAIVLASNASWNIVNFRAGLIRALEAAGYKPVVVAPKDGVDRRCVDDLGVEWVDLRISRSGLNPLAELRLLWRYRQLLRRIRPVALLSFTIKPNIYGSLAAASLKIPAFPNVSGLGTAFIRDGALQRLVSELYRLAFRRVRTVFFQNPDDRDLFVGLKIVSAKKTKVLPGSGIDLDRFAPAPLPPGPAIFLLISRLLGDKGVREYVEAARQVRLSLPDVRFQLLGPIDTGNRTGISQKEVDVWVSEGVIEYLGSTEDVRSYIAAASVIVLTSYREGLPRSLLEGAAMGRPLVATEVPGCREVIENGQNGYLCAARDSNALAKAMTKMASLSSGQREVMGAASRCKVQERFSEHVVIRAYLDELARL